MESNNTIKEFKFPVGEMKVEGGKVHPNPDKGELRFFYNPEAELVCVEWINKTNKKEFEPILITPEDWCVKKVDTAKGFVFFIENKLYEEQKLFFYMQGNKSVMQKNYENMEKIIKECSLDGIEQSEKSQSEGQPVPMSIEEFNNSENKNNSNPQMNDFLSAFSEALKNINKKPGLDKILTTKNIKDLFSKMSDETKKKLYDLLPEGQRTEEDFFTNISSAQFKQAVNSLNYALKSEDIHPIISACHLDFNEAQKYGDGVEAFIRSLIKKYPKNEEKKDNEQKK